MTVELQMLVWCVLLALVQCLVSVIGTQGQVPLSVLAGNREEPLVVTGWAGRARRAHANMLEMLPLFGLLVLAALFANKTNANTALAAEVFFWSRLAYAVIYLAGIAWVRTVAWIIGLLALVPFLMALLH